MIEYISFGFALATSASAIGYYTYKYQKSKNSLDLPENPPIVKNYLAHKTGWVMAGLEKERIIGKGGREIVTIIPNDFNTSSNEELKPITFVVGQSKRIVEKGSKHRLIVTYLPNDPKEMEHYIIDNEQKKAYQQTIIEKNLLGDLLDMIEKGDFVRNAMWKNWSKGEYTKLHLNYSEEFYKKISDAILQKSLPAMPNSNAKG